MIFPFSLNLPNSYVIPYVSSALHQPKPDPAQLASPKLSQKQPLSLKIFSVGRILLLASETRQTYSQNL